MAYPPCKKCDVHGLKILPTLYAALPASVHMQLPPGISGKRISDIVLTGNHHYGLRIAREGYLYLIYAEGPHGRNYPQGYRVVANGTFVPLPLPAPLITIPEPACRRNGHALRSSTIVIERPKECGEVFIAFSEHRWSDDTLKDYLDHVPKRRDRMQSFFPAKWVGGGVYEHGVVAIQPIIESVVEYAPAFRPNQLETNAAQTDHISTPDGKYHDSTLELESTRYPLYQRYGQARELAEFMHGPTATDESDGKPCRPMLLALWDGIGITHELNGFRNDAASIMMLYVQERALQIDALQGIRRAREAKLFGAQAAVDIANQNNLDYKRQYDEMRARQTKAAELGRALTPAEEATVKADVDRTVRTTANGRQGAVTRSKATELAKADADWTKNYQPRIVQNKFDQFDRNFKAFQDAVEKLQAKRTNDVAAWLKAPLFLDTLQDYHETNLWDGLAFEGVIAEAVLGLPSEPTGRQAVVDLLEKIDPTQPSSVIWRAYAYNQRDAKAELKGVLADVVGHKTTPMEGEGEGWAAFMSGMKKFKTYVGLRDKMTKVHEHLAPISATERFVKNHAIDRLVITLGDPLFHWLGIGKLGGRVGAGLVEASLLLRIGISKADVVDLIETKTRLDPQFRQKLAAGFRDLRAEGMTPANAYARTLQNLAADDNGQILRAKWAALGNTAAGESVAQGVRVGGVLAIIELFNFGTILCRSDKDSEDYALLVASGFSSVSACLIASTRVMTALAQDAVRTLGNLKAITGYFGGAAAGIGAVLDFGRFRSAAKSGNYVISALYALKFVIGFGAATANILTALTSSAPLVARITGRRSVVFLGRVGAGINGAAASSGALGKVSGDAVARKLAARAAANVAVDAAAADAGIVIGERGALLLLGRTVLVLGGWEIAVGLTLIQVLIWVFEPDDLQNWLGKSYFGIGSETYTNAQVQHEDFEKSLQAVGLQASEESA